MGYDANYQGRIELDPPMNAITWRRHLEPAEGFGSVTPGILKIHEPVVVPILSPDRRLVVAIEPGRLGTKPSVMIEMLRHFVWVASMFTDEDGGRFRRFSGAFDGHGESGERYRLTVGSTDPIIQEVFGEPE